MPPRKPNADHRQAGTFRRDRHGARAAVEAGALPERPDCCDGDARPIWDSIAPELHRRGLLDKTSAPMLAVWCSAFATWTRAAGHLAAEGEFVADAAGKRHRNEWARVRADAENTVIKLGAEFGLSPVALQRLRLEIVVPPEDERAAFLGMVG